MMPKSVRPIFFPLRIRASRELRMFSRALALLPLLCAFLLVIPPNLQLATAQLNTAKSIAKAYVDDKGRVHIVTSDGADIKPPQEEDQVGSVSVSIADDKETVGWLAQFPNCCTSYPIALTLVIWRSGRIVHRFGNGMMIGKWHFVAGGKQAAFHTDTVHGDFAPHYELRDLQTGRKVAKWDGPLTDQAPSWAQNL